MGLLLGDTFFQRFILIRFICSQFPSINQLQTPIIPHKRLAQLFLPGIESFELVVKGLGMKVRGDWQIFEITKGLEG